MVLFFHKWLIFYSNVYTKIKMDDIMIEYLNLF